MRATITIIALAALTAACAREPSAPDVARIYAQAAALDTQERRPVITIPGTLGSRLVDRESGVVIWGGEDALSVDPDAPGGAELIALPLGEGEESLRALRDGVRTRGVVRRARANLLGATLEIDVYQGVIDTLIAGGYDFRETRAEEIEERDQNLDAFEFPYDWRRDIAEAASDLAYFIDRKKRQVEQERIRVFGALTEPVEFDIVAHSMGTLVARYYLMYGGALLPENGSMPELTWAGAENVRTVILIAPPNAGSVIAAENLVNGKTLGPFQPVYDPALLGTHVATYQLMPRTRHGRVRTDAGETLDMFDIATWERFDWGLLDPDSDVVLQRLLPDAPDRAARVALARNHLEKVLAKSKQFHAAMDREVRVPDSMDPYVVIGGGFSTPASATVDAETGDFVIDGFEEGDGVVLRASSLLDESQGAAETDKLGLDTPIQGNIFTLLLPSEHVEITQSPVFGDNLLFWLLRSGRATEGLAEPEMAEDGAAPTGPVREAVRGVAGAVRRGVGGLLPGGS